MKKREMSDTILSSARYLCQLEGDRQALADRLGYVTQLALKLARHDVLADHRAGLEPCIEAQNVIEECTGTKYNTLMCAFHSDGLPKKMSFYKWAKTWHGLLQIFEFPIEL